MIKYNNNPESHNIILNRYISSLLLITLCSVLTISHEVIASDNNSSAISISVDTGVESPANPTYSCPMHPDEMTHLPGRCSQCGMYLTKQPEAEKQIDRQSQTMGHKDHKHEPLSALYACPMHPNETSHQSGNCPLCGMFLVKNDQPSNDNSDQAEHQHNPSTNHQAASHGVTEHNLMNHEMAIFAKPTHERFWESKQSRHIVTDHDNSVAEDARLTPSRRLQAFPNASSDIQGHSEDHTDHDHTRQNNTYLCPMHPQIVTEEPGSCPICGMDLVLKEAGLKQVGDPQVFLSSAVIQNMGIRTMTVERNSIRKAVKTQGIVTADDERIHYIHPRTGGWVERLYPITEGDRVERKDELIDFYSPWINQAQLNFITALEEYDLVSYDPTHKAELEAKVDALRNTLRLLNVSPMDLMRIEKNRKVLNTIQLMAPHGGLITELNISEGSFVEPYQSMFTIVDLSEVWVMVDIYEHQAPWVRKGHQVTIMTPIIPGRKWTGEVEFIYPEVNPKTRTLRARIEVLNPDEALLLNMFVHVDLTEGTSKENIVTVPREAIMLTGEREIIVKSLGKGHFQPVEVKTGIWGDGGVEILSGISEGDVVVVSGQFLIDSESNLQSSLLRISE